MKEQTWKRIIFGFLFLVLVAIVASLRYYQDNSVGQLTGEQYLKAQGKYMGEFEVYTNNLDNIVTLYLEDSIGEEDFLTHLAVMREELSFMHVNYQADKEAHPVKTGTHSYSTKKGCESVEECYDILNHILNMLEETYQDKEEMSYKYIAYHQDIISAVADYMTATDTLKEEINHE